MNIHHITFGLRTAGLSPSLQSALIAAWNLDGNSNDATGNGHNGTDTNITYGGGIVNQAAGFNGSTSVITVPDSDAFSLAGGSPDLPFSVSFWVEGGAFSAPHGIITKGNNDLDNTNEWSIQYFGNNLYFISRDKTTANVYLSGRISFNDSASWRHVVMTYNGNGLYSGILFYVNSVLQTTNNYTSGVYTGTHNTTRNLTIGRIGNNYSIDKKLDIVYTFNRVITQTEVYELYNGGLGKQF